MSKEIKMTIALVVEVTKNGEDFDVKFEHGVRVGLDDEIKTFESIENFKSKYDKNELMDCESYIAESIKDAMEKSPSCKNFGA